MLRTGDMLTVLKENKSKTTRVQKNPTSGQLTLGIPMEVIEAAELEKWDTVKFSVKGKGRILLEVLR